MTATDKEPSAAVDAWTPSTPRRDQTADVAVVQLAGCRIEVLDREWRGRVVIHCQVGIGIFACSAARSRSAECNSPDAFDRDEPCHHPLTYFNHPRGGVVRVRHGRSLRQAEYGSRGPDWCAQSYATTISTNPIHVHGFLKSTTRRMRGARMPATTTCLAMWGHPG